MAIIVSVLALVAHGCCVICLLGQLNALQLRKPYLAVYFPGGSGRIGALYLYWWLWTPTHRKSDDAELSHAANCARATAILAMLMFVLLLASR